MTRFATTCTRRRSSSSTRFCARTAAFLTSSTPTSASSANGSPRTSDLKDPRSNAFVENFAGQWLTLRSLATIVPDPKVFPKFDDALRNDMYKETELFFDAILREDRSILDFIDADFSFVSERLAAHYRSEGPALERLRRKLCRSMADTA